MLRALAVTLLSCTCVAPAWAQPVPTPLPTEAAIEEAREHIKRANEHYQEGEFKLALAAFQRAYDLAPIYRILFNIGQMHLQLNSYAAALVAFERYLAEGGAAVEAERREAIEAEIARLRARTGTLWVTSNVEGAEVRIDGTVVGTTPLAGVRVDAGDHEVILTKEGRSTTKTVTVAGGEERRLGLDVDLGAPVPAPVPTPPPPPAPLPPPPVIVPEESGVGAGVWVAWGITGALSAAAIGTGVAALSAQSAHAEAFARVTDADELASTSEQALRLSIAADVLIGAALISGAVSIVVTIVDATDEPAVEAAFVPGGARLQGRF